MPDSDVLQPCVLFLQKNILSTKKGTKAAGEKAQVSQSPAVSSVRVVWHVTHSALPVVIQLLVI